MLPTFSDTNDGGRDAASSLESDDGSDENFPPSKKLKWAFIKPKSTARNRKRPMTKAVGGRNVGVAASPPSNVAGEVVDSGDEARTDRANRKRRPKNVTKTKKQEQVQGSEGDPTRFFRSITAAANSITCSNTNALRVEPINNRDGMIQGFCDMQRYMLKSINEDACLQYIRDSTAKLTDLCTLERHII